MIKQGSVKNKAILLDQIVQKKNIFVYGENVNLVDDFKQMLNMFNYSILKDMSDLDKMDPKKKIIIIDYNLPTNDIKTMMEQCGYVCIEL